MKKVIAVFLSIVMCLSVLGCAFTAFAADKPYPIIYVHGFMAGSIYSGIGTDEQKSVMAPDNDAIIEAVKGVVPDLFKLFVTKDFDAFLDVLLPAVTELVGDSFFDENGKAKAGTGRIISRPTAAQIKASYEAGREISFDYDWRYSPVDLAKELGAFIEQVKAATGRDKVSISAHSYGNCVTMAYIALDENNINNLDGYVCNASAYMGESYTGELLGGDFAFLGDAIINFLKDNVFRGTDLEETGNILCDVLKLLFVTDAVEENLKFTVSKIQERTVKNLLVRWFGFWPSVWAMVPDEMYENCREYIFNDILADEDCTGLLATLDEFDSVVRNHKTEIIEKAGTLNHFGVISRYNLSKVPVSSNYTVLTDNNIDVKYSSFGASCSKYGETLPSTYTQALYHEKNYISPDRMIDASTCMFPQKTWFVKNMPHS
ncbi:MAG: hypothetical protein MJ177_05650, partial [Clostridia bacterium]|nr:hypothetical protein [Clostridia bacterium]